MKVNEIKQWRGCQSLDQFFSIKCASTALEETTFGDVVDYLLAQNAILREALEKIKHGTHLNGFFTPEIIAKQALQRAGGGE